MSPKHASPRVSKIAQPARTNPVLATPLPAVVEQAWKNDDLDKLIKLAEFTKLDVSPSDHSNAADFLTLSVQIESSKRAVKRIKLEFDQLKTSASKVHSPSEDSTHPDSPTSPIKRATRTPQTPTTPMVSRFREPSTDALSPQSKTREAQQRMDEMRQMIGRRNGDLTPRKVRPVIDTFEKASPLPASATNEPLRLDGLDRTIEGFVFDVDGKLAQAAENQDAVQEGLREISAKLREVRFLHALPFCGLRGAV